MTTFVVPFDNKVGDASEIQQWLKENRIKHGPTIKTSTGWEFDILNLDEDDIDAMAFKLTWT